MGKRSRRTAEPAPPPSTPQPGTLNRIGLFFERHAPWLALALVLAGTVRILATYAVYSYTFDEPAHIACGMEWLEKHTYTLEPQHPPLTRVLAAALPKLAGAHGSGNKSIWDEGFAILTSRSSLDGTLALARAGTLPFFWITCWAAFGFAREIACSRTAGLVAVLLVSNTPSVLAHSGLATTDMGLTAMLLLAVYAGWRWLGEPTYRRALFFGASTGFAILAKFSALVFLPSIAAAAFVLWIASERPPAAGVLAFVRSLGLQFTAAAAAGALVIWAGYWFSFGHVPAPELFAGIEQVRTHNASGHLTYLLGQVNTVGWPYFYAVALAVKMPLALLVLGLGGCALFFVRSAFGTRGLMVNATVLGILIYSSFFTNIKIGTRHVLPVFVAFGIAGGCAVVWSLRRFAAVPAARYAVVAAMLGVPAASLGAHPEYLPYFNIIAGDRPETFLVDSDLDWGQDVKRLGSRLRELGATEVYFNQYAPGDLGKLYGFPPILPLDVNGPRRGWNAVSLSPMKYGLFGGSRYAYDAGFHFWPDQLPPYERVGRGILLFYQR